MSAARVGTWLALVGALALPAAAGEATDLVVQVPTGPVLLGEWFELSVGGALPEGARLQLGSLPDGVLLGPTRTETAADGTRLVLPLRAIREGELTIEDLAVVAGEMVEPLPKVELIVKLDVPAGHVPRVAPPLDPVTLPFPRARTGPLAAALALGLAAFAWAVVRTGRSLPPEPVPVRPPELVISEALAALRARPPGTRDEVPAFVVAVSGQLRWFIEAFHGLAAPERTTEEFLAEVAAASGVLGEQREGLMQFLVQCDLVKFAAHRPEPAAAVGLLDVAEAFVDRSRAVTAEAPS